MIGLSREYWNIRKIIVNKKYQVCSFLLNKWFLCQMEGKDMIVKNQMFLLWGSCLLRSFLMSLWIWSMITKGLKLDSILFFKNCKGSRNNLDRKLLGYLWECWKLRKMIDMIFRNFLKLLVQSSILLLDLESPCWIQMEVKEILSVQEEQGLIKWDKAIEHPKMQKEVCIETMYHLSEEDSVIQWKTMAQQTTVHARHLTDHSKVDLQWGDNKNLAKISNH